jgi:hypothetical protein
VRETTRSRIIPLGVDDLERLLKKNLKMFGKKTKKVAVNNSTEEIAINFLKRAVGSINKQLEIEIARNGFSIIDLKKGKTELIRTVKKAESDDRFIAEAFSLKTKNGAERLVMVVKWEPNRYTIERNSDATAEAIKRNPFFGVKKDASPDIIRTATKEQIEIEARAQSYTKEYLKTLK